MSKLATYFKESVSVLKKGIAYARVVPVLLLALLKRLTGDGFYEVSFTKIGILIYKINKNHLHYAPYISSEKTERNTTGAASRNVRHSPW